MIKEKLNSKGHFVNEKGQEIKSLRQLVKQSNLSGWDDEDNIELICGICYHSGLCGIIRSFSDLPEGNFFYDREPTFSEIHKAMEILRLGLKMKDPIGLRKEVIMENKRYRHSKGI